MRIVTIRTDCEATLTETWTLRVTDEQAAELAENKDVGLDLLATAEVISVVNERTDGERDREVRSVEIDGEES
jgi:hypothetical protein